MNNYFKTLLAILVLVFVWSAISPTDYFTWFLEVLPVIIGLPILALTYKQFRLTNLLYGLLLLHAVILMVGGHYTYAQVPLFDWIKDLFDLSRNNYDKVGHLAQGFIPAILIREVLIRHQVINQRAWLGGIVVCICMAFSASYELFEWSVAEMTGESAEAFLGTQGYVWDTQSDILYATIGAIMALLMLSKVHDKAIDKLHKTKI